MKHKISAFYGATAFRVGEGVNQQTSKLANHTPVAVVDFEPGILPGQQSGDRVIVQTQDGQRYSVLASQVADA